ncbi:CapA family protein [Salinadaptatus halalkaliphilus]|uniref:CapA family protein n=1 Tax=Salinadaptatus halalkaliphilus TaxID=2419781 RepID=A0A4S3TRL8_9EURY|nr:CapA family protein [Salinadaptatus halalkaliphilus]THE65975.1 CapA family protein [Salinadaptatus halalkaliphilus]
MDALDPGTCTIAATGDSIITRPIGHLAERDEGFADLQALLTDADATVTNLEVVLPDDDTAGTPPVAVPSQYQYLSSLAGILMRADPVVLEELEELGIDLFATASNHSFDYGRSGLKATIDALTERSLPFAGMGRTLADARRPAYVETAGGRVGLVGATASVPPASEAGPASPIHPGRSGVNPLHLRWVYGATPAQLERLQDLAAELGIESMKSTWLDRSAPDRDEHSYYWFMHMPIETVNDESEVGVRLEPIEADRRAYLESVSTAATNADWTVASLHGHQSAGGVRNTSETPAFLRAFARECIDAGADLFVVTGPHVLRGMEIYEGRPIFYSLGNLFYQTETIEWLPPESFDYYGVDDRTAMTDLFEARYFDTDGNPAGNLARDEYWETVVPVCQFADDVLESITLHPCVLGQDRDLPRRGTPTLATGEAATSIIERFQTLSEPYGVDIALEDDVGVVDW